MKKLCMLFVLLATSNLWAQDFFDQVKTGRVTSSTEVIWDQFGPGAGGANNFLRYHPNRPDVCFLSPDFFNTYQTENNALSWTTVKDVDGDARFSRLRDMYYSGLTGSDFAIAIESSRLYTSQDMARSWQTVQNCPWYDTGGGVTDDSRSFLAKISALGLDPTNDNTWYVGAGSFPGGQPNNINATSTNPRGNNSVLMGRIFKTTDGGQSWTTSTTGLDAQAQFTRIVVSPANNNIVFASSLHGLYRSTDGGATWTNVGEGKLDNNAIMDMSFYYDNATGEFDLYVIDQVRFYPDGQSTRNDGGIFKSEDNGDTWVNITSNLDLDVNRLTGGATNSYYRYIADWFGIPFAEAQTTYPVVPTSVLQYFSSINVDPSQPNTVYVGFYDRDQRGIIPGVIWKTTNDGQSWIIAARDFGPAWAADQAYWTERGNPFNQNMVLGHQPSTSQFGQNYPSRSIRSVSVNSRGDVMFIYAHQTVLSTDGGVTWNQVDEDRTAAGNIMGRGNSDLPGECIAIDKRLDPGIVYLGSGEHHLWRTSNDGTNGRQATTYLPGTQESVMAVAVHPWDVNTVYTTSLRQIGRDRIFRSIDGAQTFVDWGKATEATEWMRTNGLRIDPVNPDFMYFGVTDVGGSGGGGGTDGPDFDREGGFHKSTNGGISFAPSNSGLPARAWVNEVEFDPRDNTKASLFAACQWNQERNIDGGLFFSSNRGETWTEIPVASQLEGINNIEFDHTGRLYATAGRRAAGLNNGGLFMSDDYGQTWTQIFDAPFIDDLAISPFDHNVIMISQSVLTKNPGIYISLDRGQTWTKSNGGLGSPNLVRQIEFDYYDPERVWIAVAGSGFYKGSFPNGADTRRVTLTPSTSDILLNETLQVTATVSQGVDPATLIYKSSNPTIATVSSQGLVTGIKRGAVRIYATSADGRYSDFVQLTVDVANTPLTSLSISPERLELAEGATGSLTASAIPHFSNLTSNITWTSSDPSIATVDANGVVTAITGGIVDITASTGDVSGITKVFVIPQNRSRFNTFENRDDFISTGGTIPEFEFGSDVDMRFIYATEIVNGDVEDFKFLTIRVIQVDENGNQVNISAFNQILTNSAPNTDDVVVTYSMPETFQDGTPIPLSKNLPIGHKLVLRPLMVANNGTAGSFTAASTDFILKGVQRSRFLTFNNLSDFIPAGGTIPEVEEGQNMSIDIDYATAIADGVEEDLSAITIRVRQLDENGNEVNISAFNQSVSGDAPNADNTTVNYSVPATFQDGTPIPFTKDLPVGHQLSLRILMIANDGTTDSFTGYDGELIIKPVQNRSRFLTFVNRADFIPSGETIPAVETAQEVSLRVNYATEIVNGNVEDFRFITVRLRQLDQNGNQVNISAFNQIISNDAPNNADVTFTYTMPLEFQDGTPIPLTRDLPVGHKFNLRILMVANDGMGNSFTGYEDEIIINPVNRSRFVTFVNRQDFVPAGGSLPELQLGQQMSIAINYATEVTNVVEEDFRFIAIRVRQLNQTGGEVNISAFNQIVPNSAPNADETVVTYTVPSTFQDGTPIPLTRDLPTGHKFVLRMLMVANDGTNTSFTGDPSDIIINPIPVESVTAAPENIVLKVGETANILASILPDNASDKSLNFTSNDETVATVNSDGVITAVGGGEVGITVTTADGGLTDITNVQVQAPFGVIATVPGVIQTENYDLGGNGVGYVENTLGNSGSSYRNDDVDIVSTNDLSGAFNITDIESGESLTYTLDVAEAGDYYLSFRVASTVDNTSLMLSVNDIDLTGSLIVPNTSGEWQTMATLNPLTLVAGVQEFKLHALAGGFDLNYFELIAVPAACAGVEAYSSGTIYLGGEQVIFNGLLYTAKYYTASSPGSADWSLDGYCGAAYPDCYNVSVWSPTTTYNQTGFSVSYEGDLYTSKWFANPGLVPGVALVWEYVGPCSSSSIEDQAVTGNCLADVMEWDSSIVYPDAGMFVTYNGHLYQNQWYASSGLEPGVAPVWQLEGPCNGSTTATRESSFENASFSINVYPNPFKNDFDVIITGNTEYTKAEMLDAQGRILSSKDIDISDDQIEVSFNGDNLAKGLYVIRLSGDVSVKMIKVLKAD